MTLLTQIKDTKKSLPTTTKTKVFAARVVNNNDPRKLQMVQVRIKNLHRRIADVDLPWALPVFQGAQGNNQVGSIQIPVVGSRVIVEFVDDYTIIYRGTFNQDATQLSELVNTDYPNCYGFIDRSGNKFFVNTQTDVVDFTHLSGMQIHIAQDGATTIKSLKGLTLSSQEDINIKTAKALNISCLDFKVNATNISLQASASAILASASVIFKSSASVVLNAASFALNAAFNLVPFGGWSTPPSPNPQAASPVVSPPDAVTPRTKPTISGFSGQLDY